MNKSTNLRFFSSAQKRRETLTFDLWLGQLHSRPGFFLNGHQGAVMSREGWWSAGQTWMKSCRRHDQRTTRWRQTEPDEPDRPVSFTKISRLEVSSGTLYRGVEVIRTSTRQLPGVKLHPVVGFALHYGMP